MLRSLLLAAPFAVLALTGCQTSGVGEPCIPQAIPAGGFQTNDIVIETTSVMCRTRVCLVYKFQGDPTQEVLPDGTNTCDPFYDDAGVLVDGGIDEATCKAREFIRDHVYCSCRCDSPDPSVPLCNCPGGFTCTALQEGGGSGLEGSYCVRD